MKNRQFNTSIPNGSAPKKKQWWKLLIWGVLFIGGYFIYDNIAYNSAIENAVSQKYSSSSEPIAFVVKSGDTPVVIANSLEKQNIISSSKYFLRYVIDQEIDSKLYSGVYELQNSMTLSEIAKKLTTKPEFITILIPEGLTISEIDARLAKKNIFTAGEFEKCVLKTCNFSSVDFISDFTTLEKRQYLEGYFFPATYQMKESELTPELFAIKMLRTFEMRANSLNILNGKNNKTLHEIVTMASIIEKESSTHSGEESNMISGVLWNRVEKGIPLGADATIRYGLQKDSSALTRSDLSADNKFNTRIYKNLPPHAIASPGEASLKAASNPSSTKYLFYLHDKNKKIHYAVNNAEHEKNKTTFCGGSCE